MRVGFPSAISKSIGAAFLSEIDELQPRALKMIRNVIFKMSAKLTSMLPGFFFAKKEEISTSGQSSYEDVNNRDGFY